jgi:hypothetical protein
MLWGPEGILTYEKMRQNILWGWGGGGFRLQLVLKIYHISIVHFLTP